MTELSTKVDGRGMTKTWDQVEQLDQMMVVFVAEDVCSPIVTRAPRSPARNSASITSYRGYAATDAAPLPRHRLCRGGSPLSWSVR